MRTRVHTLWLRRLAGGARALAPVVALALAGCLQDDGSRFNPLRDMTTISADEEREIGLEFDHAIQEKVVVIHDPVVAGFINDLGQQLVQGIEPQPFIYRFRVIKDASLNAFAVPGGYIYFHSGTVLAASNIDELAGVMGHEIAHVKGRHFVRMQRKTQIPQLLASIAGMAAAVATGEPGVLVTAQAANVAMQLRFSREFETEADSSGAIFMTRAGYEPMGMSRFFERILAQKKRYPNNLPPYLFTHPEVEDRIAALEISAQSLRRIRARDPRMQEAMRDVQARLALLVETRRASLPPDLPPTNRAITDPLLAGADRRVEQGDLDGALALLARAEAAETNDPRIPFRMGELLQQVGRPEEAIAAYRRTLRLDPSHALVFFNLGRAYRDVGDRHRAVHVFEQAQLRAGRASGLWSRANWEVVKLTFEVIPEAGFADGSSARAADTPAGFSRTAFEAGVPRMAWWARISPRFSGHVEKLTVRWTDPHGAVVQEAPAERYDEQLVGSVLEFGEQGASPAGRWKVEAILDDGVVDRRSVRVGP